MPKQAGPIKIIGTIGLLCFYRMYDEYYVRRASSLTRKRVKYDARFRSTMMHARLLGRASKIASAVYKDLPKEFRQFWMYRAFTGEALQLVKTGKTDEEARMALWNTYVKVHYLPIAVPASSDRPRRQIKRRIVSVWVPFIDSPRKPLPRATKLQRVNRVTLLDKSTQGMFLNTTTIPP